MATRPAAHARSQLRHDGPVSDMTNAINGTIVLVHGAWHGGWCFDELVSALAERGVAAVALDLPGHGADTSPQTDVAGDAAAVVAALASIDGPIVLVGHSYGGSVITQVVAGEAARSRVGHLVYVCALMSVKGKSFFDLPPEVHVGSLVGPLIRPAEGGLTSIDTSDLAAAKAVFYGDCSDAQVARAASMLSLQNSGNMAIPAAVTGPALVSSTYVACTDDRTVPIAAQRAMIDAVKAEGVSLDVVEMATSHSPFLSSPAAVAALLAERLLALTNV
jgi:pimeloyl-ACP methyl ester carboxylesterase